MDLRNYEFYAGSGSALVGATVKLYTAVLTHPNAGSVLASTLTDASGMWAFTGLAAGDYDVKVELPGTSQAKWYKGLVRLGFSRLFAVQDWLELLGQSSGPSAPAAGFGRLYFDTNGVLQQQYAASGQLPVSPTLSHARVYHNAAQALTNNANTTLAFNTERVDTDAYHDTATNNSRLIAPFTGRYTAGAHVEIQTSAVGIRQVAIFRSDGAGVAVQRFSASSAGETVISVTTDVIEMTAAQYLEVLVFQDSGGPLNCNAGSALNQYKADFWIQRSR